MDKEATFEDHRTIPYETVISCPPGANWIALIFAILSALILAFDSIPAIFKGKQIDHHFIEQIFGGLLIFAGSLWLYFRNRNSKTEFIVINNKGITAPETGFVEWSLIQNEHIERGGYGGFGVGRNSDCLQFEVATSVDKEGDKTKMIDLDGYEIETDRLEHLLQVYRRRYEQK